MSSTATPLLGEVWMEVRDHTLLVALAKSHGRNQRDIARQVWPGSKSHTNVSRILRGEIKTITPERAARWAALFNVPIDTLFVPRTSSNHGRTVRVQRASRRRVA